MKTTAQALSYPAYLAVLGLTAGLLAGVTGWVAEVFSFVQAGPAFIFSWFTSSSWLSTPHAQAAAVLVIAVLSIVVSFIYAYLLAFIQHMFAGILFGAALWLLVYYGLNPWLTQLHPVPAMHPTTVLSTLSIFILYGLFIGYSIIYENELRRQQKKA
ncbi:membrane protein YqhR [Salsuginibacillus halophilus]|uniref:Membrane protein YqhR n=1 Tax=Salsuginibacillus halophilus TaxID=517424 RepID=A0A2P8HAD0_9BACI|nr:YqhR family membrane protein [Salsuginibacillus halophilus]PSL43183.1 membrane protein YqhR [Salsuginibacillus halophilus]